MNESLKSSTSSSTSSTSRSGGASGDCDDGKQNVSSLAQQKQALGLIPQWSQSCSAMKGPMNDHNDDAEELSSSSSSLSFHQQPTLVPQWHQRATRNVLGQQLGINAEEREHDDDDDDDDDDGDDDDQADSNKNNLAPPPKEEPGLEDDNNDDDDVITHHQQQTVTFVNQNAKVGALCYTGDCGFTLFEEQMHLACQHKMQWHQSESIILLNKKMEEGGGGGLSLQECLK